MRGQKECREGDELKNVGNLGDDIIDVGSTKVQTCGMNELEVLLCEMVQKQEELNGRIDNSIGRMKKEQSGKSAVFHPNIDGG